MIRRLRASLRLLTVLVLFPGSLLHTRAAPAPGGHGSVVLDGVHVHPTRVLARVASGVGGVHASALSAAGFSVRRGSALVPGLLVLEFDSGASVHAARAATAAASLDAAEELRLRIEALRASGLFEYVEPDFLVASDLTPTDAGFTSGELWGLRNTGQSGGVVDVDIGAVGAWDVTTGSADVIVAVIDSGIRYTHLDLAGQMWRNPGEIPGNGIDDDGNGYIDDVFGIDAITGSGDPADNRGHGTHVAGIIGAAANNDQPVVGVAWAVRLMALKFLGGEGTGATSDAIECIQYAVAKGAKVVNCSWGGSSRSQALEDALVAARQQDVFVVTSAGNDGTNNDQSPRYPSGFALDNVLSVAAIDRTGALATFSNFGASTVHLAAPGVSILSTYNGSDTHVWTADGTSAAAPFVAGAVALLFAQTPDISISDVRDRILKTTTPSASLQGRMTTSGWLRADRALTHAPNGQLEVEVSPKSGTILYAGRSATVVVRVTDLIGVTGASVSGTTSGGDTLVFRDDGVSPDGLADDANYTGTLVVPAGVTSLTLTVSAVAPGMSAASTSTTYPVHLPPANDAFADRQEIVGVSATLQGTNRGASREPGEPWHAGIQGGSSVWWSWTAPGDGAVSIDTFGSSFDTILAVYTGSSVGSLALIVGNDNDSGSPGASRVTFEAAYGVTYQIAVDGRNGATGDIQLRFQGAIGPVNARFARASIIPSVASVTVTGTLVHATREPGEPEHSTAGSGSLGSAWWTWTAPSDGTAVITARFASSGAPILAVYEGETLQTLRRFPGSRVDGLGSTPTRVSIPARAGRKYSVALASVSPHQTSAVSLSIDLQTGPANDVFEASIHLTGHEVTASGNSTGATREIDEPMHLLPDSSGGESLWWSWVAPEDGSAELVVTPSGFWGVASIYTGDSLAGLTRIATGFDGPGQPDYAVVRFRVQAGVAYRIAIDSFGSGSGPLSFVLRHRQPPPNDLFEGRTVLSGSWVEVEGTNLGATQQDGEPVHASGRASHASVWWEWTAPADFLAYVSTTGSTALGVYRGEGLHDLHVVSNLEPPSGWVRNRIMFQAVAGTRYLVAVDGINDFTGLFVLRLGTPPPPSNDNFTGRVRLQGAEASHAGDAAGATVEPADPSLPGEPLSGTVWTSWVAPFSGTLTVTFEGTVTRYGIYTGSTHGGLAPVRVGSNHLGAPVVLSVVEGMEYHVLLDFPRGLERPYAVRFALQPAPANDHFAGRTVLSGESVVVHGSNRGASREPDEPLITTQESGATVWWSWTAPRAGRAVLSFEGTTFRPYCGVFVGSSLDSLTSVAKTMTETGFEDVFSLVFPVQQGVTYHIAVQGHGWIAGDIVMDLRVVDIPVNDNFAQRVALTGTDVAVPATNLGATPEPGEPIHVSGRGGSRSVWWRWTAPVTGRYIVDTPDCDFDASIGIYTGTVLNSLVNHAHTYVGNEERPAIAAVFQATAGTEYSIGVSGVFGAMGDFALRIRKVDAPDNDLIPLARVLPSEGGDFLGTNVGAIDEWSDPGPLIRTVWWRWTAPATGRAGVATAGSDFDTSIVVCHAAEGGHAGLVDWNEDRPDGDPTSLLSFPVTAGRSYLIGVGGRRGDSGTVRLRLRMGPTPGPVTVEADRSRATAMDRVLLRALPAEGDEVIAYVWSHDYHVIPGQHGPVLELPCVQRFQDGHYWVTAHTLFGASVSQSLRIDVLEAETSNSARLLNLSTRALSRPGEGVLIPGFVIQGAGTKRMLIRAIGPTLSSFGVAGALSDPRISLVRGGVSLATNDDWGIQADGMDPADIITAAASVGAFPLVEGSGDGALLVDLPAGHYTVVAAGKDQAEGVAMVELYDVEPGATETRLVNISNRGYVGVGESIMIPGFVVSEDGPRRFLIRAVGSTLSEFGIFGTLTDPQLTVFRRVPGTSRDEPILWNDRWNGPGVQETVAVQQQVGAFPLDYTGLDAAFVVTLPSGIYTVHASGKAGMTGVALVEIYLVP